MSIAIESAKLSYNGSSVRRNLRLLQECSCFADVEKSLNGLAAELDMPMVGWKPDISALNQFDELYEFHRRQGWPEKVLSRAWRPNAVPCITHVRARFTNIPFATSGAKAGRKSNRHPSSKCELEFARLCEEVGVASFITVPIHFSRGGIGVLNFAGHRSFQEAISVIDLAMEELIAAGQLLPNAAKEFIQIREQTSENSFWLTPRERLCLQRTAEGLREAQVAECLGISSSTVKYHLDNAVEKLSAANRIHAVALAAQLGLLRPVSPCPQLGGDRRLD